VCILLRGGKEGEEKGVLIRGWREGKGWEGPTNKVMEGDYF